MIDGCMFQVLARQLAEVLLRGVCQKTYIPFEEDKPNSESNPKPRKYSGDKYDILEIH